MSVRSREEFGECSDEFIQKCKRGDRIEVQRSVYSHWALYNANGYVFHMAEYSDVEEGLAEFQEDRDTSDVDITLHDAEEEAVPDEEIRAESNDEQPVRTRTSSQVVLGKTRGNLLFENVMAVAKKSMVRVNNNRDSKCPPRSEDQIIRGMTDWVGRTVLFSLTNFNSKHVVDMIRYGDEELLVRAKKRMVIRDIVSQTHPISVEAKGDFKECSDDLIRSFVLGDRIEFKRGLYSHWGLYIGDGRVIHYAKPNNEECQKGAMGDESDRKEGLAQGLEVSYSRDVKFELNDVVGEAETEEEKQSEAKKKQSKGKKKQSEGPIKTLLTASSGSSQLSAGNVEADVKVENIKDVAKGCGVRKNNEADKEMMKKEIYPRSQADIEHHALKWVNATQKYELFYFNCGHFVDMLRYREKKLVSRAIKNKKN